MRGPKESEATRWDPSFWAASARGRTVRGLGFAFDPVPPPAPEPEGEGLFLGCCFLNGAAAVGFLGVVSGSASSCTVQKQQQPGRGRDVGWQCFLVLQDTVLYCSGLYCPVLDSAVLHRSSR